VTSSKVKNSSLLARDFAIAQLPAGPAGATGATGATGPTGPQGPPGVVGAITVQREDLPLADNSTIGVSVTCPAGTEIISGGSSLDQTSSDDIHQTSSRPFRTTPGADGDRPSDGETFDNWRVVYRNPAGNTGAATAHAFAICAQT
jgi:hypothetical protein